MLLTALGVEFKFGLHALAHPPSGTGNAGANKVKESAEHFVRKTATIKNSDFILLDLKFV
jgi:hypothetical protein